MARTWKSDVEEMFFRMLLVRIWHCTLRVITGVAIVVR